MFSSPEKTPAQPHPPEKTAQKKTPVTDSMSCFPPKEKPATHSFMLPLRNLRDRKKPCRTNPIQSRTTGHGFTLMFSPKGKNSYTLFVLAFFFGMYGRAEKNSTEKKEYTIEKKNRGE